MAPGELEQIEENNRADTQKQGLVCRGGQPGLGWNSSQSRNWSFDKWDINTEKDQDLDDQSLKETSGNSPGTIS